MTVTLFIIIAVIVLDTMAVSSVEGSMHAKISKSKLLLFSLLFSAWHFLVLFLSNRLVSIAMVNIDINQSIRNFTLFMSTVVILSLGFHMLSKSKKFAHINEYHQKNMGLKEISQLVSFSSLETFALGISLALVSVSFIRLNIYLLVGFFLINALFVWVGAYLGYWRGPVYAKAIYIVNSLLLLIIAGRSITQVLFL